MAGRVPGGGILAIVRKLYKGDTGIEFHVAVGTSLATATVMEIHVQKPDGSEVAWVASKFDDTTLTYTTGTPDLNQEGAYVLQAYVEFPGNSKHHGESYKFIVYEKYT